MKDIYECSICGVVTEASEQICVPSLQEDIHDYCGTTRERASMCDPVKEHLAYVCGTCARPAKQAELVCEPILTHGGV